MNCLFNRTLKITIVTDIIMLFFNRKVLDPIIKGTLERGFVHYEVNFLIGFFFV